MTGIRTWFITGCSSGLGREMARVLLKGCDNLVLSARDPARVADLVAGRQERAIAVRLDVRAPEQIDAAIAAARARFGRIDVLVNNAGYGHMGTVEDVPIDEVRTLFETDFFGPVRLIKAVLPDMRTARSGQIVNVASVGGLAGFPGSGYYCAAKFGIVGLSEALHAEVAHLGVKVTVVEPGPFNTDFSNRSLAITAPGSADYDLAAGFERAGIAHWATQGADPAAGAAALIAALNAPDPPLHLVIGGAGVDAALTRTRERLASFEHWAAFGRFDDTEPPA